MAIGALENFVGNMTLTELSAKSGRSVGEIVGYAMRGTGQSRTHGTASKAKPATANNGKAKPGKAKPGKANNGKGVDTRSAAGRDRYDAAVLEALRDAGGKLGAVEVRKQIGGTALQARTALSRLIEAGDVAYEGKARATRYWAV